MHGFRGLCLVWRGIEEENVPVWAHHNIILQPSVASITHNGFNSFLIMRIKLKQKPTICSCVGMSIVHVIRLFNFHYILKESNAFEQDKIDVLITYQDFSQIYELFNYENNKFKVKEQKKVNILIFRK